MPRRYPLLTAVFLVASLGACGGDSQPPVTPTTMPPVTQARITVTQPSTAQLCFSPLQNYFFRLRLPTRFAESAGLGANVNFVRLSLFVDAREIERSELTATNLQALSAQRIAANATVNATLTFDFNSEDFDTLRLEFNFTDDRGNNSNAVLSDVTDLVASIPFCTI